VDPGIGFGKTLGHNLFLLKHLGQLRALRRPIVVGTSRKSFLGKVTGKAVDARLAGTIASVALSAVATADVVRVHEVAEALDAVKVADAISRAAEGGMLFEPH
jgi:dihydropteroate synthase